MNTTPAGTDRLPVWALFCIALGLVPVAIALGVLDVPASRIHAPLWVVALSGVVFVVGGCMLLLARHSRWNDLLAGLICLAFAATGLWVALFAPPEEFSGGLPLVSHATNVEVARWIFGGGALLSLVLFLVAIRRTIRKAG